VSGSHEFYADTLIVDSYDFSFDFDVFLVGKKRDSESKFVSNAEGMPGFDKYTADTDVSRQVSVILILSGIFNGCATKDSVVSPFFQAWLGLAIGAFHVMAPLTFSFCPVLFSLSQ